MKFFKRSGLALLASAAVVMACVAGAEAAPVDGADGNITPDVIFGSGNDNGSFTGVRVDTAEHKIEVGLRAKLRYNLSKQPENTFNYDGNNNYTFNLSDFNPPNAGRSGWNFEWSINADWDDTSGNTIGDYDYRLTVLRNGSDADTRAPFDPYDAGTTPVGWYDHAFGDNATGNAGGVTVKTDGDSANNDTEFADLKNNSNVSQQSWNMGFENLIAASLVQAGGLYTITLDVLAKGTSDVLASSSINVVVNPVPLPAALPLFIAGLGGMGVLGWRRKRKVAA